MRLSQSALVIGFAYGVREKSLVLLFSTPGYRFNTGSAHRTAGLTTG
jgi:hypothetical protein